MSPEAIASLLAARQQLAISAELAGKLSIYLELLLRWNARTNLSAIRDPEEIVLRHFGESLQCAEALPAGLVSLLDYGSGAGFPGAPCALARPELAVTLAESQAKKAAFLSELARTLALDIKVHAGRVEELSAAIRFGAVTLRAVDRMEDACRIARARARPGGWLVLLTTRSSLERLAPALDRLAWQPPRPLRGSEHGIIAMARVLAG